MKKLIVLMLVSVFFLGIASQVAYAGTREDIMDQIRDALDNLDALDPGNLTVDVLEHEVDKDDAPILVHARKRFSRVACLKWLRRSK